MITIEQQIELVQRGVTARQRILNARVAQGTIRQDESERELQTVSAVLETLRDYRRLKQECEEMKSQVMDAEMQELFRQAMKEGGSKEALRQVCIRHSRFTREHTEMQRQLADCQKKQSRHEMRALEQGAEP